MGVFTYRAGYLNAGHENSTSFGRRGIIA